MVEGPVLLDCNDDVPDQTAPGPAQRGRAFRCLHDVGEQRPGQAGYAHAAELLEQVPPGHDRVKRPTHDFGSHLVTRGFNVASQSPIGSTALADAGDRVAVDGGVPTDREAPAKGNAAERSTLR